MPLWLNLNKQKKFRYALRGPQQGKLYTYKVFHGPRHLVYLEGGAISCMARSAKLSRNGPVCTQIKNMSAKIHLSFSFSNILHSLWISPKLCWILQNLCPVWQMPCAKKKLLNQCVQKIWEKMLMKSTPNVCLRKKKGLEIQPHFNFIHNDSANTQYKKNYAQGNL